MRICGLPVALTALVVVVLEHVALTTGVSLQITGYPRSHGLTRRTNTWSTTSSLDGSFKNGSTSISNTGDALYFCNVTLGGKEFTVLLDTGSSDLWINGDVPGTKDLGIGAEVIYGGGVARGSINTATLQFDEFTIPDQAYLKVKQDADTPPQQGFIGLGPGSLSVIRKLTKKSSGNTPLDRIFRQNMSTPNFITTLLSRESDDSNGHDAVTQHGQLTIGELVPGLEKIADQPKLPARKDKAFLQHWQVLMDSNGITGPDGKPIETKTSLRGTKSPNQLTAMLDTGFTFPQVPGYIADAIYGRIPGAEFVPGKDNSGRYNIPCGYALNITFHFAGVPYPIHPLDLSFIESTNPDGTPAVCFGTFGSFDMILGMAFLRNTYALMNYGDFVDGSNDAVADPYVQLLSVTEANDAHADFVKTRLGGFDTTGSQPSLLPPGLGLASKAGTGGLRFADKETSRAKTIGLAVIVGVAVGGGTLLLLICSLPFCYCKWRRRSRDRRERLQEQAGGGGGMRTAPFTPSSAKSTYTPLHDPESNRPGSPEWDHRTPMPVTYGAGYGDPPYGSSKP